MAFQQSHSTSQASIRFFRSISSNFSNEYRCLMANASTTIPTILARPWSRTLHENTKFNRKSYKERPNTIRYYKTIISSHNAHMLCALLTGSNVRFNIAIIKALNTNYRMHAKIVCERSGNWCCVFTHTHAIDSVCVCVLVDGRAQTLAT